MTTHDQNLRAEGNIATEDEFGETDSLSVEQDDTDLLFTSDDKARFTQQWIDIQSRFVDDPYEAVESADDLVGEMMERIGRRLTERRTALGEELEGNREAETEDLRLAIQRYRAFFQRLLAA